MEETHSIDQLLERAVSVGASDLHITAGSPPALRVRGELTPAPGLAVLEGEHIRGLLYRILTTEQQKRLELDRQLDFSYSVDGLARFRVNAFLQRETFAAAFRVVPNELKTLEELGLPESLRALAAPPARARRRHRPDRLG